MDEETFLRTGPGPYRHPKRGRTTENVVVSLQYLETRILDWHTQNSWKQVDTMTMTGSGQTSQDGHKPALVDVEFRC